MKNILLLVTLLALSANAAADCRLCQHHQFGEAYCGHNPASCYCDCQPINADDVHTCFLCGGCDGLGCLWYCDTPTGEAAQLMKEKLPTPEQKPDISRHPWLADTVAAQNIRTYSNAMSVVFEQAREFIKKRPGWANSNGWASTTKGNPADANGWVNFELISRDNGIDEIRIVYEKSRVEERLVLTPTKKWVLYRIEPDADHVQHKTQLGRGDLVVNGSR